MSTKIRLMILFAVLAIIVLVLGIIWLSRVARSLQASELESATPEPDEIILALDNGLDEVSANSTPIYSLTIVNNSKKRIGKARVSGYLGMPTQESDIEEFISEYVSLQDSQDLLSDHSVSYYLTLGPRNKETKKFPIKIKKYFTNQTKVYSKVCLELFTKKEIPWWNIFAVNTEEFSSQEIACTEDIDDLN